jgi:sugar phosphate permease
MRHTPKDIRGAMSGALQLFGYLGMAMFAKLGGVLYDSLGSTAPFLMISICDMAFAVVVISLFLLGKWRD